MSDPARLLKELESTKLFTADLPKRRSIDHATWSKLSTAQQFVRASDLSEPNTLAQKIVGDEKPIEKTIRALGNAKYEAAIPTLTKLWKECPHECLRYEAGCALRTIGTDQARAALAELIFETSDNSVQLAIAAIFDAGTASAFERLSRYFDESFVDHDQATIARNVFAAFCPNNRGDNPPLFDDDRWIKLLLRFRHHRVLGDAACNALARVDRERCSKQLHDVVTEEAKVARRAADPSLLSGYLAGEHEAVWNELRQYRILEGDYRQNALDVARETMRRVNQNIVLLCERLEMMGWPALAGAYEDLRAPMDELEAVLKAPLPPTLRAFWEIVGGVDLAWDYNSEKTAPRFGLQVALDERDPMLIYGFFNRDLKELKRRADDDSPFVPFYWLTVAPDELHKINISGSTYDIGLPFLGADPMVEGFGTSFLDYIRTCLKWGGFPGLRDHEDDPGVQWFVKELTKDFVPF